MRDKRFKQFVDYVKKILIYYTKNIPILKRYYLLEEGLESCHIICIFDDKNDTDLKNIKRDRVCYSNSTSTQAF